jgi:hypothetical protein
VRSVHEAVAPLRPLDCMDASRFIYSKETLLQLRAHKTCCCVNRRTKRRLQFFRLYVRHISVVVQQRNPPQPRKTYLESTSRNRVLKKIRFVNKERSSKISFPLPSLFLTNARSVFAKMDELRLRVRKHKPSIVVITESWLDSSTPDTAIGIDGYIPFRKDRNANGGGILCYVPNDVCAVTFNDEMVVPDSGTIAASEFLCVVIKDFSLVLIAIYHPFWDRRDAHEDALSVLTGMIDSALLKFGESLRILVCGDFNGLRDYYTTFSHQTQLKDIVDFPTRCMNVLDQIFVNFAKDQKAKSLPALGRSDHCSVLWEPKPARRPIVIKHKVRKFSRANVAKFNELVISTDWVALVNSVDDIHVSTSLFLDSLFFLYDRCFPERTVRMRQNSPGWFKPSLQILLDDRDRAHTKKQWSKVMRLRAEILVHIKRLKQLYVKSASTSPRPNELWNAIRCVGGLQKKKCNENFSIEDFNMLFSNNFQREEVCSTGFSGYNCADIDVTVSLEDVRQTLLRLRNKGPGPDGIPAWVFKTFANFLCKPICDIFNRSLRTGSFPMCLKSANITPVPKVSSPKDVSDFRPISILPMLSKIFEKLILRKVFLPRIKSLVDVSQFAYIPRAGSGTVTALVLAYHKILQFLDSPGIVRVLSTDFSKAFDKLPHQLIVKSFEAFSIPAVVIRWISSFLCDRRQRVKCNGCVSRWSHVPSGVPQGSVIGPILFCMATNDLQPFCNNTTVIRYADDVTYLHFLRSPADDALQSEWENLVNWSRKTKLPLNHSKCKVMDIITKKHCTLPPIYTSSGELLEQVTSLPFLGVTFSSDLGWNAHFDNVINRASKRIFLMRNLRKSGCSKKVMIRAYVAFIRPILLYAYPCVCNAPLYLKKKLRFFERRVVRIVGSTAVPDILDAADSMCLRLMESIVSAPDHPLGCIAQRNGGRRTRHSSDWRRQFARTKRFSDSFIQYISRV